MPDSPTRLSILEMLILRLLVLRSDEMFGLEMVEKSRGRLKRGTVYVTLGRLSDKGYVESRKEEQRPGARGLPRRLYKITGLGQRTLADWELIDVQCAGGAA